MCFDNIHLSDNREDLELLFEHLTEGLVATSSRAILVGQHILGFLTRLGDKLDIRFYKLPHGLQKEEADILVRNIVA